MYTYNVAYRYFSAFPKCWHLPHMSGSYSKELRKMIYKKTRCLENEIVSQPQKYVVIMQCNQLTNSERNQVIAPSILALRSSSLAWKLLPVLIRSSSFSKDSRGSVVVLKAWRSLFLMFSSTIIDTESSYWVSGFIVASRGVNEIVWDDALVPLLPFLRGLTTFTHTHLYSSVIHYFFFPSCPWRSFWITP